MKTVSTALVLAAALTPALSMASPNPANLRCKKEVTFAIQKTTLFNVVEKIHSTDGTNYVVIFRTASGDAEQASVAVVTVDPKDCAVKKVKYVKGAH